MADQFTPTARASSTSATGSPFIVGRPLRADEPIFGRDEVFRFVGQQLARFSSVNIVGERRMGKSSLLNHLLGHPEKYLSRSPDEPPLLLARVDMQAGVSDPRQFYRLALVEWLKGIARGRAGRCAPSRSCRRVFATAASRTRTRRSAAPWALLCDPDDIAPVEEELRYSLAELRQWAEERLSIEDLKVLCFDLGIEYENLQGETKSLKIVSLLTFAERKGGLPDLIARFRQDRSGTTSELPGVTQPAPVTSPGSCVRPVIVLDEFERLLEVKGFPFPDFYNGLRALITEGRLAMLVASRRPLIDYFTDPSRPGSMTSTFPSYFVPYDLESLDDAAADALLLQPSDQPLTLTEVAAAKRWTGGHPCHLQCAGAVLYDARVAGKPIAWADKRFAEISRQACSVGHL